MHRKDDGLEPIEDKMGDDTLYIIFGMESWMMNIIRAIRGMPLDHLDKNSKRRIVAQKHKFYWDAPYLYRLGEDGVLRRCVEKEERQEILRKCPSSEYRGHYGHFQTNAKV